MIKWKIQLETTENIANFVRILNEYPDEFIVSNESGSFKVNGKSLMGMLYTTEWGSNVYLLIDEEPLGLNAKLMQYID